MRFPCKTLLAGLGLAVLTVMLSAADVPAKVVIWKLDDLTAGEKRRVAPGFKRVADWADQNKSVVTFGIICESLSKPGADDVAWIKQHAIENGGRVEFWLHGWDHKAWEEKGVRVSEFKGTSLEQQTKHFKDSCEIFAKTTGVTLHVFGAPYNQFDANTATAMDAVPELTIWMYGAKGDKKRTVLAHSIDMEVATGKVSYDAFMKAYLAKVPPALLVMQGHCGMWDDKSFTDFTKIAAFLAQEGWVTKTCGQFVGK